MSAESIIVLSEVVFVFLCCSLYRQAEKKIEPLWLVWTAPAVWQWIIVGNKGYKIAGFLLLAVLLGGWHLCFDGRKKKLTAENTKRLLVVYALAMVSLSGVTLCNLWTEQNPVFQNIRVISIFVFGWTFLCGVGLIRQIKKDGRKVSGKATISTKVTEYIEPKPIERMDIIAFAVVFVLAGIVTFWGLGGHQLPQTAMEIAAEGQGENEFILDMGKETQIQTIQIHLGHIPQRVVTLYSYDEAAEKWNIANEKSKLESNYAWNELWIKQKTRYLKIAPQIENAVFDEVVLQDSQGNILLPENADEYPRLFDEQELFASNQTYYDQTMFDEIYYAGSAWEFLQGMEMYETTHPPLGKILMAIGIGLFGLNPFGWRFVCAVFGLATLPVMYWLLYRMFRNGKAALLGMTLLSLDFMHYTLSRIATLDAIIAFFVLTMFAVMWQVLDLAKEELEAKRNKPSVRLVCLLTLCAFVTGMAAATKWTGFYALVGITICFGGFIAYHRKKGSYPIRLAGEGILLFAAIPSVIYTISFLPQTLACGEKNVIQVMWNSSLRMLRFHEGIKFEHTYSSPWYTWAWMKTPLVDMATDVSEKVGSLVVTLGNPVIWWCGLAAVFVMLYRALFCGDRKAGYLACGYLVMYLPWMFVQRTIFIYQYYCSSLFLICMLSYCLYLIGKKHRGWVILFLVLALLAFVLFYPVISGRPVGITYVGIWLEWLRTWKFVWL